MTGQTRGLCMSGRRSTAILDRDLRLLRRNYSVLIFTYALVSSSTRKYLLCSSISFIDYLWIRLQNITVTQEGNVRIEPVKSFDNAGKSGRLPTRLDLTCLSKVYILQCERTLGLLAMTFLHPFNNTFFQPSSRVMMSLLAPRLVCV